MNERAKSLRYSITTLTPLHIGCGEFMTPVEYHVGDELIVPELERIFSKYPEAAVDFNDKLTTKSAEDLARTEMAKLIDPVVFEDREVRRYVVTPLHNDTGNFDSLKTLRGQIRNGQGEVKLVTKTTNHRPYIPGSSIKGAFRTAWAYEQCNSDLNIFDAVSGLAWQGTDRNADQRLNSRVFQAPSRRREEDGRTSRDIYAAFDVFRSFQIGDSTSRPPDEVLLLVAERVLSAQIKARAGGAPADDKFRARFKDFPVFFEAIDENFSFDGRISFDRMLLTEEQARRTIGWTESQTGLTPEKVLQAVNRFAADLCQWEIDYFERIEDDPRNCDVVDVLSFYDELKTKIRDAPPNVCFFSFGHGSGWHKLTIGLMLEKRMRRDQFAELRRSVDLARDRADFEYPKSRRLVMNGKTSAYSPFGWVQLKLV
jgi:CRISPR-associated protein Csm5